MDKIQVGKALRERRESMGHSQADLAHNLGCNVKTVSRWELGESLPSGIYRRQIRMVYEGLWPDWV